MINKTNITACIKTPDMNLIISSCLLFTNILFFIKFLPQITDSIVVHIIIASCVYVCAYFVFLKINCILSAKWMSALLVLAWVACMLLLCSKHPLENIDTDRWSAITVFWDKLFSCEYPYSARTVLGNFPTSLPALQVLCLPFYFTSYVVMSIIPLIPFLYASTKNNKLMFMLIASPALAWCCLTRDTIVINSVYFLFVLWFMKKHKRYFITGILLGFLVNTRLAYIIPIALLIGANLDKTIKILAGIVLGVFVSLAPMFFWGIDSFINNNPISAQAGHMPIYQSICLLFIAFFWGIKLKESEYQKQILAIGLLLFASAMLFQINRVISFGYSWETVMEKKGDISYFILSYPFFLAWLNYQSIWSRGGGIASTVSTGKAAINQSCFQEGVQYENSNAGK